MRHNWLSQVAPRWAIPYWDVDDVIACTPLESSRRDSGGQASTHEARTVWTSLGSAISEAGGPVWSDSSAIDCAMRHLSNLPTAARLLDEARRYKR